MNIFSSLKAINLSSLDLYHLPLISESIEILRCNNNNLTQVINLPKSITEIYANNNNIKLVNFDLPILQKLFVSKNKIKSIELGHLTCLKELYIGSNKLIEIKSLPPQLTHLYCLDNNLSSLPLLPDSLQVLNCAHNNLTKLPNLNSLSLLKEFHCDENKIDFIFSLPPNLEIFGCSNNRLVNLPPLPISLKELICNNNIINTVSKIIPFNLKYLNISSNNITSLPLSLRYIKCYVFVSNLYELMENSALQVVKKLVVMRKYKKYYAHWLIFCNLNKHKKCSDCSFIIYYYLFSVAQEDIKQRPLMYRQALIQT
jgi:Leucine-rich repeat (LRR) protein